MGLSRRSVGLVMVALLLLCVGTSADAQTASVYPNKVVRIIVPSTAGGPPDQIARMLATKLTTVLGQPVIVENRAGAGGMVGTAYVAKTPPDGYTVLITTASHAVIPAFTPNTPYDAVKDFSAVTMLAENFGQVLVVRPSLPAKTVQELVALARKQPGKLSYGQAGAGTASHIPAEVMIATANIDMLNVPYKGTSAAMVDLLGGHIDMFFIGTQIALPLVQDGKLRALAVTGKGALEGHARRADHAGAGLQRLQRDQLVRRLAAGGRTAGDCWAAADRDRADFAGAGHPEGIRYVGPARRRI